MTDCPPEYTNVGEESFGDGKKVTSTMLRSFCRSIAYLRGQVDDLWDSTDPELKKRFRPVLIDPIASYGVVLDDADYKFNPSVSDSFTESFTSLDNIIVDITTARVDTAAGEVKMKPQYAASETNNPVCEGPWGGFAANQFWYVGYNKYKNYWASPEWFANPASDEIPAVCRAQTFLAAETGQIHKVMMKIRGDTKAEDTLILELRTVDGSGVPTQTILGRAFYNVKQTAGTDLVAFYFNHPVPVTTGTTYALVLRSPFTSYDKHYGVGGWSANCHPDPYADGYAFLSENNGKDWIRYGKDDANMIYGNGRYAPREFAFSVFYKTITSSFSTSTPEVVYLQPYSGNPVTRVVLSVTETKPANTAITYEVSNDFTNWHAVSGANSWTYDFASPTTHLWIRATLSTTESGSTPSIQDITATLTTDVAEVAYLRTMFYNPRITMPLGASIWSEIGAPVTEEPNTEVTVDIIRNVEAREFFVTNSSDDEFTLSELPAEPLISVAKQLQTNGNTFALVEGKDFTVDYDTGVITTAAAVPTGHLIVEYNPLFIKGLTQTELPLRLDLFEETFTTVNAQLDYVCKASPVDPVREVTLDGTELIEDEDFTVNYLTKTISLNVNPGADKALVVKYTPFIQDTGLAVAYRMARDNTVNQAYVHPNYYQYRV
jgi:hypothetical protein